MAVFLIEAVVAMAVGAVMSTVTVKADEATETLPAASVCLATILFAPAESDTSMLNTPALTVAADPSGVNSPLSTTPSKLPASTQLYN